MLAARRRNGRKKNINYLDMIYHDIEEKGVGTGEWLNIYDKIPFAIHTYRYLIWHVGYMYDSIQ